MNNGDKKVKRRKKSEVKMQDNLWMAPVTLHKSPVKAVLSQQHEGIFKEFIHL